MAKSILALAAIVLVTSALAARGDDEPAAGPNQAEMFGQLDTNKDGLISTDEVPEERKRLFERLVRTADKNSDGKLDNEEFAAGLAGPKADETNSGGSDRPREQAGDGDRAEKLFGRLDANNDGKVALDEVPEQRRAMLEKLIERGDKDGDKALSREEFAAAMPGGEGRPGKKKPGKDKEAKRPEPDQLFGRLDANSDGKVALAEVPEQRRGMLEKLIERGDKDGDKALSKEEFASAMPGGEGRPDKKPGDGQGAKRPGRPEPGQLFARLDANGDGKVTLDEVPEQARPRIERLLKVADKDGDGAMSKEEAAALPRPEGAPGQGRPGRPEGDRRRPPPGVFAALDADHDGKLSSEEISASAEVIRKLDTDGDGSVTIKELLVAGGPDKPGKE